MKRKLITIQYQLIHIMIFEHIQHKYYRGAAVYVALLNPAL